MSHLFSLQNLLQTTMYAWHGYAITKFSLAKLLETGHCVGFKTKKLASKKYEVPTR